MERSPLRGEGYQRDGASSDSPILIFSLKLDFFFLYTFFEVDYFESISLNPIFIFYLELIISIPFRYA